MKLQITILALCMAIVSHAAIKTPCAKIILNSGRVIEAEILEMNPVEIRYKKCGQTTDVEYILAKETVLVIKNSEDEVIFAYKKDENDAYSDIDDSKKQYEAFSILAFIFALIYPLLGLIFALVSALRLSKAPNKYKKASNSWLKWAKGILIVYGILILLVLAILFRFGAF
ncbi:MAG: hypothetical protein RIS64_1614 [Bacteroidota bacterium]